MNIRYQNDFDKVILEITDSEISIEIYNESKAAGQELKAIKIPNGKFRIYSESNSMPVPLSESINSDSYSDLENEMIDTARFWVTYFNRSA